MEQNANGQQPTANSHNDQMQKQMEQAKQAQTAEGQNREFQGEKNANQSTNAGGNQANNGMG